MSYIKELCDKLIRKHKTRDPIFMAELMGINVWYRDLGGLKGFYLYERKSRYIVLNTALEPHECKVIAAHELGHDTLHRQLAREGLREQTMFLETDKTELQANIFAAELLIDDAELLRELRCCEQFSELMEIFGLPAELLFIKIEELNKRGQNIPVTQYRRNFLA